MHSRRQLVLLSTLLAGLLHPAGAADAIPARTPLPVSVSSANYAGTRWDEIRRIVADPAQVNPAEIALEPRATPQTYVFAPGELYESDVPYEELCRQLEGALAKKGFINAADAQGRVAAPDKIDLILRLSSGGRRWRNPTVRTDKLTWDQGLTAEHRSTRSLLGGQMSWDNRAGGNDDALATAIAEQGKIGSTTGGTVESTQGATAANAYQSTREFFLLVVDAFGYQDLLKKQAKAPRLWTTFVALPQEEKQTFSQVLATMLRVATPYFGETTRGLQMFTDARATVKLGELEVLDADVKPAAPAKK
jgi:hypothetical protein